MANDDEWSEQAKATLAGVQIMADLQPFLDTLNGMVAQVRANGFTDEQARAIVAFTFGWRPSDGSTPEGAG